MPLAAGAHGVALLTMIGGISAATGMVVLDSLALAITISNNLVMPLLLRRRVAQGRAANGDIGALVLWVRRAAILGVLALGFGYERVAGQAGLAAIGLLSFAAIAQIAPAFLGALFWRRGTARGAIAGMATGSLGWVYLLLLPSIEAHESLQAFLSHGPLAIAWLSPAALVAFAPSALVGGVILSLGANIAAFVAFSLTRQPSALERTQASAFAGAGGKPQAFRLWRSSTTAGELEAAGRPLSGSVPGAPRVFRFPARGRPRLRPFPGGERATDPPRGIPAVARHRRLDLAPGAVAALEASRRVRSIGVETDRRSLGGDPVEPRPVAACARPRAPGRHGLRRESSS